MPALGLQWADFTADFSRVTISRRVSIPAEGKEEEDRIARPKSRNGVRTLPISEGAQQVLIVWKAQCSSRGISSDWLFAVANGNPMNYSNVVTKWWLPLLKRSDVEGFGIHSLRHYYASLLMSAGMYKELSSLLGHHSSAFTMDTYGHLIRDGGKVLDEIAENVSRGVMENDKMSSS